MGFSFPALRNHPLWNHPSRTFPFPNFRNRRRLLLGVLTALFLENVAFGVPKSEARSLHLFPRTFLLDPGHGGKDPGASGFGVVEREVNLAVARALAEALLQSGHVVVLTRTSREGMLGPRWRGPNRPRAELEARTALGNAVGADAYLSIHCNFWAGRGRASGAQVFIDEKASRASVALAQHLMTRLRACTGTRRKVSRRIEHFVLKHVAVPVVTVEMGFLSDPEEASRLGDPAYQRRIARCLAAGITTYLAEAPYAEVHMGSGTPAEGKTAP